MLKELGEFVEALHHALAVRGISCPEEAVQIQIKCRSIVEWGILDQAIEGEFRELYGSWRSLIDPPGYDRVMVPHMLSYKRTPIRITYG